MHYLESMDAHQPGGIEVEKFDHVILYQPVEGGFALRRTETLEFEGQVVELYPRAGEVKIVFDDWSDPRRDGTPKTRRLRVPLTRVEFVARDG